MTSFDLDLSKYKLGWSDTESNTSFKPKRKGLNDGRRRPDQSWMEGRAAVDAQPDAP
jgi:hypothetical protein